MVASLGTARAKRVVHADAQQYTRIKLTFWLEICVAIFQFITTRLQTRESWAKAIQLDDLITSDEILNFHSATCSFARLAVLGSASTNSISRGYL